MNQLHEYLAEYDISTPAQFGFRHGHSTILQLINCHLDWVSIQNDGFATDVVFLDFQKAFDSVTVVHSKLLFKLAAMVFTMSFNHRLKTFSVIGHSV